MRYLFALLLVLCAVPAFAATATLDWTDTATNEAGFEIERAPVACAPVPTNFAKIGEAGVNAKQYVDTTPIEGNQYCWRVRAWNLKFANDPNSRQYSAYSNLAGKDFPLASPASPSLLQAN